MPALLALAGQAIVSGLLFVVKWPKMGCQLW